MRRLLLVLPAVLALSSACTGVGDPPPRTRWTGGAVDAVPLADGGVATLSFTWRTTTPLVSPPRVPRSGVVTVRATDAAGTLRFNSLVAEGELARPVGLVPLGAGTATAVHEAEEEGVLAHVLTLDGSGTITRRVRLAQHDEVDLDDIVAAGDTVWVAGTTTVPLYGTLQSPGLLESPAPMGFVARLPGGREVEWVELWHGDGPRRITALAPRAEGPPAWIGTARPSARPVPHLSTGTGPPAPWPDPAATPTAIAALPDGGVVVAGWTPADGSTPLPGAESLSLWVTRLAADGSAVWHTTGCCATWRHPIDLQVEGERVRLATRVDSARLALGDRTATTGAGLRGALATLELVSGAVTELTTTAPLDLEPMALPVGILGDCGVFGDGEAAACPATPPAATSPPATSPPAPPDDAG